jgi:hypothetical protein
MARRLLPEDRLDILRKIDWESGWSSLDDRRICLLCERLFTGRQVEIDSGKSSYTLHCPTPGCPSHFTHWSATAVHRSSGEYQAVDVEPQNSSFFFEDEPFARSPGAQPGACERC